MEITRSKNLFFRSLSRRDVNCTYVNWLNDPEVNQYLEVRHRLNTIENCIEFVEVANHSESEFLFGIFFSENQQHIGNTKIGSINQIHRTGELSLFIGDKSYWGRGLAKEIVNTITEYGFSQLNLHKIGAGCYQSNYASLRTFLGCGYVIEGFAREQYVFNDTREGCFRMAKLRGD